MFVDGSPSPPSPPEPGPKTPAALTWALIGQGFSSAANFSLALIAARLLGPSGLGTVAIGLAAYLMVLGFQRSLLSEPLIASSATLAGPERGTATRCALTVALVGASGATLLLLLAGLAVPGFTGHGILLFVPWLAVSLLHDLAKAVLFRDGHGAVAAASDIVRFAVLVGGAAAVWSSESDWLVVGCWGVAAAAGMAVAVGRMSVRPEKHVAALGWWLSDAWPFGRWLGVDSAVYTLGYQATLFVLAAVVGAASLGGLQAIQSVFTPLTLLLPAFTLAGLPPVARRLAVSWLAARKLAIRLGLAVTVLTAVYVGGMAVAGSAVLGALFGSPFERFSDLILPISLGALTGGAIGFQILLKAQRRGRRVLAANVGGNGTMLVAATLLALAYGVEGAAWGLAAGQAVGAVLLAVLALGRPGPAASTRPGLERAAA
jgi:O-antigen/teichoic acid export membrane protein